jgi:hypothetical protein
MFESPNLTLLDSCLWDWMNRKVYGRKVDVRDKLLARIVDAAACTKKREVRLRRELQSAVRLTVGFSNIHCEV